VSCFVSLPFVLTLILHFAIVLLPMQLKWRYFAVRVAALQAITQ
jgi:hypothetical protein